MLVYPNLIKYLRKIPTLLFKGYRSYFYDAQIIDTRIFPYHQKTGHLGSQNAKIGYSDYKSQEEEFCNIC